MGWPLPVHFSCTRFIRTVSQKVCTNWLTIESDVEERGGAARGRFILSRIAKAKVFESFAAGISLLTFGNIRRVVLQVLVFNAEPMDKERGGLFN